MVLSAKNGVRYKLNTIESQSIDNENIKWLHREYVEKYIKPELYRYLWENSNIMGLKNRKETMALNHFILTLIRMEDLYAKAFKLDDTQEIEAYPDEETKINRYYDFFGYYRMNFDYPIDNYELRCEIYDKLREHGLKAKE